MAEDLTRALTAAHRIKPTSTSSRSARRSTCGRGSTHRRGILFRQSGPVKWRASKWFWFL